MQRILEVLQTFSARLAEGLSDFLHDFRSYYWPRFLELLQAVGEFLGPRWKRAALIAVGSVSLLVGGFTVFVYVSYLFDSARIHSELAEQKEWLYGRGASEKKPPIRIYGTNGRLIGEYLPERGSRMTMQTCEAADWLRKTAIASEDRDFYEHGGVSYRGIARAAINNVLSFSLREGAGTITQQLGRNLFTDRARTLYRKLYETFAAWDIEDELTKEEILCLYLNKIYMGEGRIGAEEASWFYFRKPPEKLSAAEAAMIVGLFPSPVAYSPLNNIELSSRKQEIVLDTLVKTGHLDEKERNLELQRFYKRYDVAPSGEDATPGLVGVYGASRDFRLNSAPTANEYVKDFLYDNLPEEVIREGGLDVYTTIDPIEQRASLAAIRRKVEAIRAKVAGHKNEKIPPERMARIIRRYNGVFVSMDSDTGAIRAIVGGYGVSEGAMTHRPWVMRRQPGSTIKGFLYAVALDEGVYTLNQWVKDERINIGGYSPRNWNGRYLGWIQLRRAAAMSVNTVAVKTLDEIGAGTFRSRVLSALDIGFFESDDRFPPNLSLALGAGEVSPVELARIYALVENGGRAVRPWMVERIENADGEVIWENYSRADAGAIVLDEESCAGAVKLLTYVFDESEGGTVGYIGRQRARNANYLPFPIAGKTGTVQTVAATFQKFPGMQMPGAARDAWFVGLTPGRVGVVWLGHDEGAPFPGSGSQAAAVWAEYAQSALSGRVTETFPEVEMEADPPRPDAPQDEEEAGDADQEDAENESADNAEAEQVGDADPGQADEANDAGAAEPEAAEKPETPEGAPGGEASAGDATQPADATEADAGN